MRENHRRSAGFTMTEVVVVVAIMAILLAVAIPSVAVLRKSLKMTELDAAARAIFVAAQDNLERVRSAGLLDDVKGTSADEAEPDIQYMLHDSPLMSRLLPVGAINPEVAGREYLIQYNQKYGVVLEVFYAERDLPTAEELFAQYAGDESGKVKNRRDRSIGYYAGGDVKRGEVVELPAPVVQVTNGEVLSASVLVPNAVFAHSVGAELTLAIRSEDGKHEVKYEKLAYDPITGLTGETVLDSLVPGGQFKDGLGTRGFPPGCNLVFSARLIPTAIVPGVSTVYLPSESNIVKANSLFSSLTEERKDGASVNTAAITAGRHLQNLRKVFSGVVPPVGAAIQQKAVDWSKAEVPDFYPIVNDDLKRYEGKSLPIEKLVVKGVEGESSAGLFGALSGGVALNGVTLVNANVTGAGSTLYHGTLAGSGRGLTVTDCAAYVEVLTPAPPYRYDFEKYSDYAMVSGAQYVGGLVGYAPGCIITGSYAALPGILADRGGTDSAAGGLVGVIDGGGTITSSYAAVDQLDGRAHHTGMLVGLVQGDGARPFVAEHSYATGNISATGSGRYGFMGVVATPTESYTPVSARDAYAAVSYLKTDGTPIAGNAVYSFMPQSGAATNCAFLSLSGLAVGPGGAVGKTYDELRKWGAGKEGWANLNATASFPYIPELLGREYPFPALTTGAAAGLHRGSWPLSGGDLWLAYFEVYSDGGWGFAPGSPPGTPDADPNGTLRALTTANRSGSVVVRDGYALMSPGALDSAPFVSFQQGANGAATGVWCDPGENVTLGGKPYHAYPLPREALQTEYAGAGFYQSLYVEGTTFWYEPHFAATVSPGEAKPAAPPDSVRVRSARQLYNLGRLSPFWAMSFQQELDLDCGVYQWKYVLGGDDKTAAPVLTPIGGKPTAFTGTYSGAVGALRCAVLRPKLGGTGDYIGLFGIVGRNGDGGVSVRNLTLDAPQLGADTGRIGLMVGENQGEIKDCAVVLPQALDAGFLPFGGFVAVNGGSISSSGVYGGPGGSTVSGSSPLAGFALESSQGSITSCFVRPAEGKSYDALVLTGTGNLPVSGFVHQFSGVAITNCYAAATVSSTGAGGFASGFSYSISNSAITGCYANCKVSATGENGFASGFAYMISSGISNCYALLSVSAPKGVASGFAYTAINAKNCYTASAVTGATSYGFAAPGATGTDCYYLAGSYSPNGFGASVSASGLRKLALGDAWTLESRGRSFPFDPSLGDAYPFPRVKALDHVGDWPELPQMLGFVYYERYDDKSYSLQGLDADGKAAGNLKGNERSIEAAGYGYLVVKGDQPPARLATRGGDGGNWALSGALWAAPVPVQGGELYPFSANTYAQLQSRYNWDDYGVVLREGVGTESWSYGEDMCYLNVDFAATITPMTGSPRLASPENPLQVRTQDQLSHVGNGMYTAFLKQTHNIPVTGSWTPIQNQSANNRTFDGGGNVISGLPKPLIDTIQGESHLMNLTLEKAGINLNGSDTAGILINTVSAQTEIQNCMVRNSSISGGSVSGFAGKVEGGAKISGCAVENVTVTATAAAAGFVLENNGVITDCGVYPTKSRGYRGVSVSSSGASAAGFANSNRKRIASSYAVGTVSAPSGQAAGFVWQLPNSGPEVSNSYSNCLTSGDQAAGFVYSVGGGTVRNCYALLSVDGARNAYGFAGNLPGAVEKFESCYSAATVSGGGTRYGFSPKPDASGDVVNCFYLAGVADGGGGTARSYDKMTGGAFPGELGVGWGAAQSSTPFRPGLNGQTYPFPALAALAYGHYGDWPEKESLPTGLVYYETYKEGGYGFYGVDANGDPISTLRGNSYNISGTNYGALLPGVVKNSPTTEMIKANTLTLVEAYGVYGPAISLTSTEGAPYTLFPVSKGTYPSFDMTEYMKPYKSVMASAGKPYPYSVPMAVTIGGQRRVYNVNAEYAAALCLEEDKDDYFGTPSNPLQIRTQEQLRALNRWESASTPGGGISNHFRHYAMTHNVSTDYSYWPFNLHETFLFGNNNRILNLGASGQSLFYIVGSTTKIYNVIVDSAVVGTTKTTGTKGIFADVNNGALDGCQVVNSSISVKSGVAAAGFVGSNTGAITNCSAIATGSYERQHVAAEGGGAAGFVYTNTGAITGSRAVGTVTAATGTTAGFVGNNSGGQIERSYSNCRVSGSNAAGFAGSNTGAVSNCYALLEVTGKDRAAGFALAPVSGSGTYTGCYSAARVLGPAQERYGFAPKGPGIAATSCSYLFDFYKNTQQAGASYVYDDLKAGVSGGPWAGPGSQTARPFDRTLGASFPFAMLQGLTHYGDWPRKNSVLPPPAVGDHVIGAFHYQYDPATGYLTLNAAALYCEEGSGNKWTVKKGAGGTTDDYFNGSVSFYVGSKQMEAYPRTGFGVFWSGSFPEDAKKMFYYNNSSSLGDVKPLGGSDIGLSEDYRFAPVTDVVNTLGFQHNQGGNANNWAYQIKYNESTGAFDVPTQK